MSESDDEEKSVVSFEAKKRGDALFPSKNESIQQNIERHTPAPAPARDIKSEMQALEKKVVEEWKVIANKNRKGVRAPPDKGVERQIDRFFGKRLPLGPREFRKLGRKLGIGLDQAPATNHSQSGWEDRKRASRPTWTWSHACILT